jgi:hypothetical protein
MNKLLSFERIFSALFPGLKRQLAIPVEEFFKIGIGPMLLKMDGSDISLQSDLLLDGFIE